MIVILTDSEICHHCEEYCKRSELNIFDGQLLCGSCFFTCPRCNEIGNCDDDFYCEDCDTSYCKSCLSENRFICPNCEQEICRNCWSFEEGMCNVCREELDEQE